MVKKYKRSMERSAYSHEGRLSTLLRKESIHPADESKHGGGSTSDMEARERVFYFWTPSSKRDADRRGKEGPREFRCDEGTRKNSSHFVANTGISTDHYQ